jgi:hypothetical protein
VIVFGENSDTSSEDIYYISTKEEREKYLFKFPQEYELDGTTPDRETAQKTQGGPNQSHEVKHEGLREQIAVLQSQLDEMKGMLIAALGPKVMNTPSPPSTAAVSS